MPRLTKAQRELAAWQQQMRATDRRLLNCFCTGVGVWLILQPGWDGYWMTPWILGISVWFSLGLAVELPPAIEEWRRTRAGRKR